MACHLLLQVSLVVTSTNTMLLLLLPSLEVMLHLQTLNIWITMLSHLSTSAPTITQAQAIPHSLVNSFAKKQIGMSATGSLLALISTPLPVHHLPRHSKSWPTSMLRSPLSSISCRLIWLASPQHLPLHPLLLHHHLHCALLHPLPLHPLLKALVRYPLTLLLLRPLRSLHPLRRLVPLRPLHLLLPLLPLLPRYLLHLLIPPLLLRTMRSVSLRY